MGTHLHDRTVTPPALQPLCWVVRDNSCHAEKCRLFRTLEFELLGVISEQAGLISLEDYNILLVMHNFSEKPFLWGQVSSLFKFKWCGSQTIQ